MTSEELPESAMPEVSLGRKTARGGAAVGLAQLVKIGTQFVSIVLMARLLDPGDFGLIAAISPLIGFVGLFQDLGLQQAIVQRESITEPQLNRIFWATVKIGVASALAVMALSPLIALFYGDPRLTGITIATSAVLLFGSLSALPMGLLNRHMRFGRLAMIDIASSVGGVAAGVVAALLGCGYWSLVIAPFVTMLISLGGAWNSERFRPRLSRGEKLDSEILAFGKNLTGFNLINFFARNIDNVLIGRTYGSVELGYYDRAYKLLVFPLQNINQPLSRVMVPWMSRLHTDKERLREVYLRTITLATMAVVPGIAAALATSDEIVAFFFDARWQPVAPIFAWLGLAGLVQPLNNSTGWLFISQGKTQAMFRWGMFSSITTIAAIVVGLPQGAIGVARAYALTECVVRLPALYWVMGRIGPVSMRDLYRVQVPLLISAALTYGAVQWLRQHTGLQGLWMIVPVTALSYLLSFSAKAMTPHGRQEIMASRQILIKLIKRDASMS